MMQGESEKLLEMDVGARPHWPGSQWSLSLTYAPRPRCISDPNRPIGSFCSWARPVSKTELAKALAEFQFDDERALVRIDMSEYSEAPCPPGRPSRTLATKGGQLTEAVRCRLYGGPVDEVEKAHRGLRHPAVVLDDGRSTDGQAALWTRNVILILTSNLGSQYLVNQDFPSSVQKALEVVQAFAPSSQPTGRHHHVPAPVG